MAGRTSGKAKNAIAPGTSSIPDSGMVHMEGLVIALAPEERDRRARKCKELLDALFKSLELKLGDLTAPAGLGFTARKMTQVSQLVQALVQLQQVEFTLRGSRTQSLSIPADKLPEFAATLDGLLGRLDAGGDDAEEAASEIIDLQAELVGDDPDGAPDA